jgi:hypothetical protein
VKKIKLKEIRLAYKISIASAFLLIAINAMSIIFVLLPIYNLVGDTEIGQNSVESDKKLNKAEKNTGLVLIVSYGLIVVSLGSGAYGAYEDIRKKPKK